MESTVDVDRIFLRLMGSKFRAKQKLQADEVKYLQGKGLTEVLEHARQFIIERLADAQPANDGKQTPMHGHPVFVAQHATATCCRGCLMKWHGIAAGRELSESEVNYIVDVIDRWLCLHDEVLANGLRVVGDDVTELSGKSAGGDKVVSPIAARFEPELEPPEIAREVQMEEAVIFNIGDARQPESAHESDELWDDETEPQGADFDLDDSATIEVVLDDMPLSDEVERLIAEEMRASKKKPKKKKTETNSDNGGWVQGTLF